MSGLVVVSHIHEDPVVWCLQCGSGFGKSKMGRPYEEHVALCAERHADELRAQSYRVKAPGLFDPFQSGDVEFGAWVRANSAAIFHRRLKI
jgi:hypothetical protein